MAKNQQATAAKAFAEHWEGKGYEKGESQPFWLELLQTVFGVERPYDIISFENQVKLNNTSFIDAYIEPTHVLIEQKSIDQDLRKGIRQSDGSILTPFQQAKRYAGELPYSRRPRWTVVSNFRQFYVYDMENPQGEPEVIELKNLETEYYRLQFLVDTGSEHLKKEMEVSLQAGEIIGEIYEELLRQYINPDDPHTLRSLNILCVRLVFCFYAEDAGIFGEKRSMFHDYLSRFKPGRGEMRKGLIELFEVLNTPVDKRDPYMDDSLKAFPYCNGGLFADRDVEIPRFNDKLACLILKHASDDFDWSRISPTIFGAVFESTLNPETRRSGGMHYTSIENIHKVIDPLFLDDLKAELAEIKDEPIEKKRVQKAREYQDKLASLKFLDPACGSGNFLTETYLSLRRLENEVMPIINDLFNPIKVDIHQFYGIEINDFAVSTATTALWIAEAQMMAETERLMHIDLDFLPLKTYHNIVEGNALRMDWNEVVPASELNYIMGNPPFVGARMMAQGSEQKKEIEELFGNIKDVQDLDYVCGWYKKAAEYISRTSIQIGFVSTNSICQGSQVPILWGYLSRNYGISINYAYRTFKWNSESSEKAAVYCVIVGFGAAETKSKRLYDGTRYTLCENINPYLIPGDFILVEAAKDSLCGAPKMNFGNQPRDGGSFILFEEERAELLSREPSLSKWIRQYMGAEEFINGKKRYCLWLKKAEPTDIKSSKELYKRVEAVLEFRSKSSAKTTRGYAKVPHLFAQITQPDDVPYLLIPRVSSERRRYVPIGYLDGTVISSDAVQIIPEASIFHFGILTSNVHMAWMRTVCGRLEMRYRYSKEIVYNTFPWPSPTDEQKARIEQTAQAILDARARYPDSSLADLYDEVTMPADLRKAHQDNDRAVMAAYGMDVKTTTESSCVALLLQKYKELTCK
ncbi:MAG: methylase [Bacteroidia bacterium]|nr:methylase [Bacteroidia bacterium]